MFRIPFSRAKSNGSIVKSNRIASRHRPLARKMFLEPLEARTLLSATVYPSVDEPLTIPDQTTITSTLVVPDAIIIDDINVELDITHTRDQDLDVFLIAPNGWRVELMTDVGGGGDNFEFTTLDDGAPVSIVDGSAPFAGSYRPEGSLSVLNGLNAGYNGGEWTLEVTDDKRRETGTLNSWSIEITSAGPAAPTLAIGDVSQLEGDSGTTAFVFTVARSGDTSGVSSVDWSTANGTAIAGSDYNAGSGALTFLAGETSKTITVQVNGDESVEPDETFVVDLMNPTNATIADAQGQGTITNDDDAPLIVINDLSQLEGDSGTTAFVFTVTRSGHTAAVSSFDWSTADETATAGSDYTAAWGTVVFLPGETSQTITVQANGDTMIEPHETFVVNVTNPINATIATNFGVACQGTITNDENQPPTISINDGAVIEGDESFGFLDEFASSSWAIGYPRFGPDGNLYARSHDTDEVLRFDGTTGELIDAFVPAGSGGLDGPWAMTFGPNDILYVSGRFSDNVLRYDGTTGAFIDEFVVSGSGGLNAPAGMAFGSDGNLYVSSRHGALPGPEEVLRFDGATGAFIDVFVTDGSGGLDNPNGVTFGPDGNLYVADTRNDRVNRYDGTTGDFIDIFVAANSGGIDVPTQLEFRDDGLLYVAGQGSGGSVNRYDETTGAFVDSIVPAGSGGLINVSGFTFGADGNIYVGSTRYGKSVLRFGAASQAVFTVSLSTGSALPVTVNFSTADGTANAGSDYTATSGTITFAPGETSRTIVVSTLDDTDVEGDETFVVNLSNATGATIIDGQGEATITDDDAARQITISDVTVTEGDESIGFLGAFISAGSGGLDSPKEFTFGPDGNLYVINGLGDSVLRYDGATGKFIDVFVPASAGLDNPQGILFGPDGNLYVSSRFTDEVLRFDSTTGALIDAFVTAGNGGLDNPVDITFGGDGNLYVTSRETNEVLRYNGTTGAFIDVFVTDSSGGLDDPHGLQFGPDGNLYVVQENGDPNNDGLVLRYDGTSGAFIDVFVTRENGSLNDSPNFVFGPNGDIYVSRGLSNSVQRYDGATGAFIEDYVSAGSGSLAVPIGLLFDADGNLYVSSRDSDEILRYGAASQAVFTVSLSSPSATTVTVDYTTADGTAKDGVGESEQDYTATSGTVVFDPGVTSRTILVPTLDDTFEESAETFFVNLSNAAGATIQDAQGEGIILDDDAPGTVFNSQDVPKTIADPHPKKGPKPAESQLLVSAPGDTVGTLDVDLTIVHALMSDLTVTLRSPGGLEKPLSFDGGEWNLAATTDFWGQSLDGDWTLTVTDTLRNTVTGTLENWSITVSTLSGPGVTVTPISGLSTSETGDTATFMVILNSQPTGVVKINLVPDDTTEGQLVEANSDDQTLTFDPAYWWEPQYVTVIGVDDSELDGDVFYDIITVVSESEDPYYWNIDPDDVTIINLDDGVDPAQLLADFGGAGSAAGVTSAQLQQVASQALALWSSRLGAPVEADIQLLLADLPAGRLGEARGHKIVLDGNANGAGWFVDPTPWEHSEFLAFDSLASGRVDLLTVVTHEIGHTLGFEHSSDQHDVMAPRLGLGTRRLPGGLQFTSPLAPLRFQALDELFAAFAQMEDTQRDDEDQASTGIDDELLDLLAFTSV